MNRLYTAFRAVSALLLFALLIFGCKKKEDDFVRIQTIVPQNIIDDLKSKGMVINEGIKPPTINDAYRMSPYKLQTQHGPDDNYEVGKVIPDYYYKFYEQNDKNEIKYDFYNDGSDKGEGEGAFIAGDGNKFTIFSEESGESGGVNYKRVTIISGEVANNAIRNYQLAFVLKEKTGDENNQVLIGVNKGRVWYDGDIISERIDNFRNAAEFGNPATTSRGTALSNR